MDEISNANRAQARSVRYFVETIFRHKKKAIAAPIAILALAVLVILFAPRKYPSEAKIFIQIGRESINLDPTATTGDTISLHASDRAQEIKTVIDMLQSRGVVEKVVQRLGPAVVLGQDGPGAVDKSHVSESLNAILGAVLRLVRSIDPISDTERAVLQIERNLVVEAERDSMLVAVQYEGKTPSLAQLVTHTLIEIYREEHLRLHHTSGSKEFFAEQHQVLRKKLDTAVSQLQEAKNRLHLVSLESRRQTLESRLANIELTRYQTLQQLAAATARVAELKLQIAGIPQRVTSEQTTVPDTGTDLLRAEVYELQVLMLDQQSKYRDDHPFLQATREKLREAIAMLENESPERRETTDDINPKHETLTLTLAEVESERAGILAQRNEIDRQRKTVLEELQQLNNHELEIDQLTREAQLARTNFFRYAENLEQARIDDELNRRRISNVIVAQSASLTEKPSNPNKAVVGVLALIAAMASALSVILVAESTSDRIVNSQQLEQATQIPVLGTIPEQRLYAEIMI